MEKCFNCGKKYEYVYRIPDELWNLIVDKKSGMLCIDCLNVMANGKDIYIYFEGNNGEYISDSVYISNKKGVHSNIEIKKSCRENYGIDGAFNKAVEFLKKQYAFYNKIDSDRTINIEITLDK